MNTDCDTAIAVPVTTRGIGIHTSNYYALYQQSVEEPECTVSELYRVSLLQLDAKMQANCREYLKLDPKV